VAVKAFVVAQGTWVSFVPQVSSDFRRVDGIVTLHEPAARSLEGLEELGDGGRQVGGVDRPVFAQCGSREGGGRRGGDAERVGDRLVDGGQRRGHLGGYLLVGRCPFGRRQQQQQTEVGRRDELQRGRGIRCRGERFGQGRTIVPRSSASSGTSIPT
jgi:hypothetical protein